MANTFHQNLMQSFANFKSKYIGNVPSGVTLEQINGRLTQVQNQSSDRVQLSLDAVAVGKDEDGDTIYEKTFKGSTLSSRTAVDSNLTISNLKWIRLVGGCVNDNDKTMYTLPYDATTSGSRYSFIVYSNSDGLVVDYYRLIVKMYHFTVQYVLK